MIRKEKMNGKNRVIVEFNKDIFISSFENKQGLEVLLTLTDKTDDFKINEKLDLDKDYNTTGMSFDSLDPKVVLKFNDPKSIRNMILLLQDAEELLKYKLPKKRDRS